MICVCLSNLLNDVNYLVFKFQLSQFCGKLLSPDSFGCNYKCDFFICSIKYMLTKSYTRMLYP